MIFDIKIFSDYICPFCYVGKGLVGRLKEEFTIRDEWINIEIHPDTPQEGVLLTEKFPGMTTEQLFAGVRRAGALYGIAFGQVDKLANSRQAIEASEYAREHGKFEEFHDLVLHAYFTEARDIGAVSVLLELARQAGLDAEELQRALEEGRYAASLEAAQEQAYQYGVSGTPTFIVNNKYRVVGAQSLESFRSVLKRIEEEETD
ncbi:putative DsbA family dithiol-disulfide isomerase [Tumebacillus sp. BK434]|uniref:DsbA family oxidoreductase n=1 Tax=Tumebacillus sp. BK434 TaxID=2512169 RepID=UPI0010537CA6|nr:DsbA family oxidoreductase [Tumebacillus sp. BK434]TCP57607.1 putative DsbA family dithiol-disulfide isomerase [Tumebacillus sp. BK434]